MMKLTALVPCIVCLFKFVQALCPLSETADFVDFTDGYVSKLKLKNRVGDAANKSAKTLLDRHSNKSDLASLRDRVTKVRENTIRDRLKEGVLDGAPIEDSQWYPWMISLHELGHNGETIYICRTDVGYEPVTTVSVWQEECEQRHEFDFFGHRCGGSLLNHKWALTAKHCVYKYGRGTCSFVMDTSAEPKQSIWVCKDTPVKDLVVIAGSVSRVGVEYNDGLNFVKYGTRPDSSKGTWLSPRWIGLMNYDAEKYDALFGINLFKVAARDIALIKLNRRLSFSDTIRPIYLAPDPSLLDQSSLILTGWGIDEAYDDESKIKDNKIVSTTVTILKAGYLKECGNFVWKMLANGLDTAKEKGYIDKLACLVPYTGRTSTDCPGDSGGPLFARLKSDRRKAAQLGIVSVGMAPCVPDVESARLFIGIREKGYNPDDYIYSLFKRASECVAYNWIRQTTKSGSCYGAEEHEDFAALCTDAINKFKSQSRHAGNSGKGVYNEDYYHKREEKVEFVPSSNDRST